MSDAYLKVKDSNGTLSLIREEADGSFADLKSATNHLDGGSAGQVLRKKTGIDYDFEWASVGQPTDSQTQAAVSAWLEEHPEATTTVQDGSLTEAKFTDELKLKAIKDYVTPQMFGAKGDGATNDLASFNSVVASMSDGDVLYIPNGEYLLNDTWTISKNITVYCDGTIKVTHSEPVIILNALSNAKIDINTIEKSARVFDYVEGGLTYSIGVILKNCDTCIVNIDNLLNVTTGIVLLGCDANGCHYNEISCNNAHTFEGIELIRQSSGGWVNGNVINKLRWMVNTWFDNTNLVPSYMVKSLSYATSSETEAYKINANMFNNLSAEYGAGQADYPISLVRLDNARGYTFNFNRVEILAKSNSLYDNFFYFTNSVYCIATIWFMINSFEANLESGTHCFIYQKTDYEGLKAASYSVISISDFSLHQSVSYAQGQFQVTLYPATALCRLQGELIINSDISGTSALISNLPSGRAGHDTMSIQLGTRVSQWSAPTDITYYKLFCGGQGYSKLGVVGGISAGTHLFIDMEYVVDESVIESLKFD